MGRGKETRGRQNGAGLGAFPHFLISFPSISISLSLSSSEQNRDISEKVALGLAKPSGSSSQLDSRLFNREAPSSGFGEEDSYNLYDKPLFAGSSAAAAIYSGKVNGGNDGEGADEAEERVGRNDRFGLGVGRSKAFEGAEYTEVSIEALEKGLFERYTR